MKTWIARVQETYASLEELERYNAVYDITARCGFESTAELWEFNPYIGGSTDPKDFGRATSKEIASIRRSDSV